jgi:RNA polymerase sigma-70 factor (ECF subfamily)
MHDLLDEELARRVQETGDQMAFGLLVERFEKKLLGYGRRFLSQKEDVADLVQEVFLKSYTNIQSFDTSRKFSPWIYRIAHNVFVNALKKRSREPLGFFDPDTLFPHIAGKESSDRGAIDKELRQALESSLDTLDAKYREPLVLYYFEDLAYEDIADILHIPVSTVGVRLKRGRDALKKVIDPTHVV